MKEIGGLEPFENPAWVCPLIWDLIKRGFTVDIRDKIDLMSTSDVVANEEPSRFECCSDIIRASHGT